MFIAINYINCEKNYRERFELLMKSRKKAVDTMPGFRGMEVLKPTNIDYEYLIISRWDDEKFFISWQHSAQFTEGHRRGFEDISKAKKEGNRQPMLSTFKTYEILTR